MKWRARMFYWSRQGGFLWRLALGIMGAGFGIAWLIVLLMPQRDKPHAADPVEQNLRTEWQRLSRAKEPQPRLLSRWLRRLMTQKEHLCEVLEVKAPTWRDFQSSGILVAYDAREVLTRHAPTADQREQIESFIAAWLGEEGIKEQAKERLVRLAAQTPPMPLANELLANVLLHGDAQPQALEALIREGMTFADAEDARVDALRVAVQLKDRERLRSMVGVSGWQDAAPPLLLHRIGELLHDPWLQWKGLLAHRLEHIPYGSVFLALFAAGLWYAILVLHSHDNGVWRWTGPVLPIMAGVASVWPTLTLMTWQNTELGWTSAVPFPEVLWYYILGVGLREELCKLLLFALFLPWLLKRRMPGAALMTGAFVGLGFSLEENITYYEEFGTGVALGRFLSANFLHAALTGIAAQGLYGMLRSRFSQTAPFLVTFATVVSVHGVYDYAAGGAVQGLDLVSMILLAVIAWQFFDFLAVEVPYARQTVAPAAVFVLGLAFLTAVMLVQTALQVREFSGVVMAASQALMMAPVALIYWRRFDPGQTGR